MTALHPVPDVVGFSGEVHEYADRWPMRGADEIEDMAASIRERGQRFPIVLTPNGVLADGRNRLRACEVAGVAPWFEVRDELVTDADVVAFIWDANGDRRDMSKGQKAMLAALGPGSVRELSSQASVNDQYIHRARQVIQWCPADTVDAVIAGTLALNDAYEQAQQIKATEQADEVARKRAEAEAKRRAEADAARLADLRAARPDLAALVDAGNLALNDALTVRDKELAAQRKAASDAREWRRKLADGLIHAALNARDAAHPNNLADTLAGLAENPPWDKADITPAGLRRSADCLRLVADALEAQS